MKHRLQISGKSQAPSALAAIAKRLAFFHVETEGFDAAIAAALSEAADCIKKYLLIL